MSQPAVALQLLQLADTRRTYDLVPSHDLAAQCWATFKMIPDVLYVPVSGSRATQLINHLMSYPYPCSPIPTPLS